MPAMPAVPDEAAPSAEPAPRSPALLLVGVVAVVAALKLAEDFFLPAVLAMLMSFVLAPLVRVLRRARLPAPLAAGVVLVTVLGGLGFGFFQLAQPAADWMARAPRELKRLESALRPLVAPVEKVQQATEQVERIAGVGAEDDAVTVKQGNLGWRLVLRTGSFLGTLAAVVMLLYFLLASGDLFLRKLMRVLPSHDARANAVEIARDLEADVSRYLFMVCLINLSLGAVLAGVFAWIGLPSPLLWGALATSVAFIPYIGHWFGIAAVGAATLLTLQSPGKTLAAVGIYALVAFLEGNVVSPMLMGRRMVLNPVAVFAGLLFFTWLWGVPGAFLAVPVLATLKILSDHLPRWGTLGEFLGR
jgi:predicted PurR-regulated permease PerM